MTVNLNFQNIKLLAGSRSTGRFFESDQTAVFGSFSGTVNASFTCDPCPVGVPRQAQKSFNNIAVFGVIDRANNLAYVGMQPSATEFVGVWLSGADLKTVDSIVMWLPTGGPNKATYEFTRKDSVYSSLTGYNKTSSQSNFVVTINAAN